MTREAALSRVHYLGGLRYRRPHILRTKCRCHKKTGVKERAGPGLPANWMTTRNLTDTAEAAA